MQTLQINNLKITIYAGNNRRICYLLYPFDVLAGWAEGAVKKYDVSIAVLTGMDWNNALTPWKAPGVPTGTPDFKGEAQQFLTVLRESVLPQVEKSLTLPADVERTLAGVSLSGLFTLWQWLVCDEFANIISLSGSFWYDGFVEWVKSRPLPEKSGRAYFLLGNKEAQSPVPQFRTVQTDTEEVVEYLSAHGIRAIFELVPGNHYQYAEQRLNLSFARMFGMHGKN